MCIWKCYLRNHSLNYSYGSNKVLIGGIVLFIKNTVINYHSVKWMYQVEGPVKTGEGK